MKFNRLFLFGFILAGLLVYISCRKVDSSHEEHSQLSNALVQKFFSTHRSADPAQHSLVEFFKKKNEKEHFIDKTVKLIGFPFWDKMLQFSGKIADNLGRNQTGDSVNLYLIPFV